MNNEYKIPEEIKSCIPDHFYHSFVGELVAIKGPEAIQKKSICEDEEGVLIADPKYTEYSLCYGTDAWILAMFATCEKLNLMWLYTYWMNLGVNELFSFDFELREEMIKKVIYQDSRINNSYRKYIEDKRKI